MRVLLYIQKHPSETLTLGGKGPDAETIQIITDSSHEEHASLSGVMIVMGTALIDWICRRQKTASRSSLESEAKAFLVRRTMPIFSLRLYLSNLLHVSEMPF